MNHRRLSRRRFILTTLLLAPGAVLAEAGGIEPDWVKVRQLRLTGDPPRHRFVHFSDLHHKGDRAHTQSVVDLINAQSPDFVCFTGDIIEEKRYLPEALELLSGIKAPLYGVPGNHDYWSHAPFNDIRRCFAATGGAWLLDEHRVIAGGQINLVGATCMGLRTPPPAAVSGMKNILLMHYPAWVKKLGGGKFDLILAGHSHGGQVRIPFYGPVIVPRAVDEYDLGLYRTESGPLYVTSGIGWFPLPLRFNCRPEITAMEI